MKATTAKKVLGSIVAAVTLTMVTSVSPASAAPPSADRSGVKMFKVDTGWD